MEKSVDAFRTISEVADDLQVPQHVLRFWETRFSQIRPLKRAGGRRYYRPGDVLLLRSIRQLLYDEGYTIKGVQRLLKDKGARAPRDEPDAPDSSDLEASPISDMELDQAVSRNGSAGNTAAVDAPDDDVWVVKGDWAALRETLTIIEECERILQAIRRPCP